MICNVPIREDNIKKYNLKDDISFYRRKSLSMRGHGSIEERPHNYYPIYVNIESNEISLNKIPCSIEIFPHVGKDGKQRVWDYPKDSMDKLIEGGDIDYLKEKNGKISLYKKDRTNKGMRPKSLWLDAKYDSSAYGAGLLKSMFNNDRIFDYPKSLYAVIDAIFVSSAKRKNVIVLDFFAGSGTTGHSVLEMNKEDGGNRQFILCTNNENNICTDVCYPRVKKVIEGYRDSKGRKIERLGGNLKYFKTSFVDSEPTDKNKKKLTQQATEMLCIKEGTFEPVPTYAKASTGRLDQKDFKIFKNSDRYTGIIFDQLAIPEFKKAIKDVKGKISIYVFSLSDETFDEEFVDVKQKVKLSPIPEAILRVYRRIFREEPQMNPANVNRGGVNTDKHKSCK
jgi:adenine-specific DNA-methyltransferase